MKRLPGGKKLTFIIAALALVAGVAAGILLLPMAPLSVNPLVALGAGNQASPESAATHEPQKATKESEQETGVMYPMKERVVNLADSGTFHYLKAEIVLEYQLPDSMTQKGEALKKRQDEFVKEMANRRPRLDDVLTSVLGSKTSIFLSTPEGRERLRDELKVKLAEASGEHKLINVYFTQFIIQ